MSKTKSTTDLFKKAILVAVGATAVTVEKVNSVIDELVDKGELSEGQAKSFKDEIKEKVHSEKEAFENKISSTTQKVISKVLKDIGVATKSDIEELEKKLTAKIEGKEYIAEVKDHCCTCHDEDNDSHSCCND
ncbi:MAG: phasin family protein [Vampirovibrionia bacterium]